MLHLDFWLDNCCQLSSQKILHLRLLIGFLNASLGNTVQKGAFKRHLIEHLLNCIEPSVYLFLSCIFYFPGQIKKRVTEWNNRSNLWSLSSLHLFLFSKLFPMQDQIFMTSSQKGVEILKFVTCLWIQLFLKSISVVHFCK